MTSDTRWLIGTIVVLSGLQIASVNTRIDDLSTQISSLDERLTSRIDRLDDRLRAVEVSLGESGSAVVDY